MVETILLMPIFFLFVFGLLQIAQLGLAAVVANYAASSIARKAASEQTFPPGTQGATIGLDPKYSVKAEALMVAGMELDESNGLVACIDKDTNAPTSNLLVVLRAKLTAWPVFGNVVHAALKDDYDSQGVTCSGGTVNTNGFGPFNFSGQAPYYFYVTGSAKVRLNYTP